MKFPPEFLDEIRTRLPVSEVAGKRVKLRKEGREWRGLSPFTSEKTPSFFVNDQKGFFHDFSSGKHGDAFAFLMETEGLSFPEAVERLAGMAGLPMPRASQAEAAEEKKRLSLLDVMGVAARLFEANLQAPIGARARGYLADRNLGAPVQQRFGLGYASPERFALRDALAAQGASAEAMIEAGLLVHGQDIAVPYDRFRDRVMFPIHDRSGRVIAFGGRAMEAGAKAKYLNSPETPLFHKGALLFNHHRARKSAHDVGSIIVVEGYIDAIAMSEAGFPNVVAPLGTALTPDQCQLLWAMASEPILCFDGDGAGRRAAFRAIETALPHDRRGQEPALHAPARRPGSGRSHPAERAGGDGRASGRRAPARRDAVHARDRRRAFRHARTARGARAASFRGGRKNRRRTAAPPLPGGHEAAPLGFLRRRAGSVGARRGGRAAGLLAAALCAIPSARSPHWAEGSAVGPAEQARPQIAFAGTRSHDPFDCAWPSGADREPLRGAGGGGIHGRGPRRVPGRAHRRPGGGARIRPLRLANG